VLGASSTVVSVDAKKRLTGGWDTFTHRASKRTGLTPVDAARRAQDLGAGEILLSSIDRESSVSGYDLPLIEAVTGSVSIPVIALGGARGYDDFAPALRAGASAVAAGSMFVYNGKHRAVLISYPNPQQLRDLSGTAARNGV
jgi:cyclase